jgi:PAS domain S-box-containing protein
MQQTRGKRLVILPQGDIIPWNAELYMNPHSKEIEAANNTTGEFSPHLAQPRAEAGGRLWHYILTFFAGAVLIGILTGFHILEKEKAAIAYWQDQQSTIADDRARLISIWLGDRLADTELLSSYPSVRHLLFPVEKSGSSGVSRTGALENLLAFMDQFAFTHGYAGIYLFSPEGGVVVRSTNSASVSPAVIEKVRQVSRGRAFWVGLLGETQASSLVYFFSPVFADTRPKTQTKPPSSCLGVFALQIDPKRTLFPILMAEGVVTRSGETFLLRREGNELVNFSPLRSAPLLQGFLRRPLSVLMAEAGWEDKSLSGARLDYRGVPVLSAARLIPLTDWILVRKIDRKEALEDFYVRARLEAMVGACIILIFAYLLVGYRRKMLARALKEQVAHQQAILALQAFAQEMVDNVPVGLLVLSSDLNVLSANRTFLEEFHVPSKKVIGQPLPEVIQAEGPPRRIGGATGPGSGPHDVLLDLAAPGEKGSRPSRLTLTQISNGQGKGRILLTVEDQTESESLRAVAEASERRLRELVQSIDVIVWEADAKTHQFTFVSRRAEQILGYPAEQWLTQADFWVEHLHPLDRQQAVSARQQAIAEGRDHSLEYRVLAADGREVWLHDTAHVVLDAEGRPIQLRGVAIDSSREKLAQAEAARLAQQLRQAQKMEAVGRLAGGVAHDFNNMLTIISGYGGLLLEHPSTVGPLRGYVNEIMNASGRATSLTRQLLAFSRQHVLAPRVLDLNAVVANIEKMLKRLIGEDIDLVTVLGESLWPVKVDPGQLEQVLLNLAVNARDAMPNGGTLTIETMNVRMDSTSAQAHFPLSPGPYVLLAFSDTGIGMDAETQARIFEPFFTTKEKGKGTGLGLAMVYGIVKQSGGYIWVYSEVGKGTTFKIYLPRSEERVDESGPGQIGVEAQQGTETILLVEDEEAVRALVRNVFREKGYRVLEASRGREALELSELYSGQIDLLVTDVVMPQMSGRELARRLVHSRPQIKVLYISGYADDAVWYESGLDSGGAFLQKPFSPEALARKVREVLAGPPHWRS